MKALAGDHHAQPDLPHFNDGPGRAARAFDGEHARLVEGLARFASNAFLLQQQARNAVVARDEMYRANRRLTRILQGLGAVAEDLAR